MSKLKGYIDSITDNRGKNPSYYRENDVHPVLDNSLITGERYPKKAKVKRYIDSHIFNTFIRKYSNKNDVAITLVGNGCGKCCLIPSDDWVIIQNAIGLKTKSNLDSVYLFYYLKLNRPRIMQLDGGSSQPNIRMDNFLALDVDFPNLNIQKNIARVLFDLDEKIELNNKINTELEATAKLIYDYWFVQFDFPDASGKPYKSSGGKMVYNQVLKREIPDGWSVKTLNELSNRIGDGIHGTPQYVDESEFSFINGNNLKNGFIYTDNDTKKVSAKEYDKYFIKLDKNTILMSINGTLGNLAVFTDEKVMLGKSSAYINCLEGHRAFCYQYLKQSHIQKNFWNIATGSTIKNLSLKSLNDLKLSYPNVDLILKFNELINPLDGKRENIFKENKKLIELRNWLLPMLMNGQVTVKDA